MATIQRSTNCSQYTDTISVVVGGTASVKGRDNCSVPLASVFSCQTSAFEKPDDATRKMMTEEAMDRLEARGCPVHKATFDFHTNLVGAQSMEYSANKLKSLGMASNCYREGNDPNHATHRGTARCFPMREMTDAAGNRVINTNMAIHSNLAVCDISDEAMPQVQEDLRKVAADNAADNGFTVDKPEDLACTFAILPTL